MKKTYFLYAFGLPRTVFIAVRRLLPEFAFDVSNAFQKTSDIPYREVLPRMNSPGFPV